MPILTLAARRCPALAAGSPFAVLSLRQLLHSHAPLLVLDATSPRIEASLWRRGDETPWAVASYEGEASLALPQAVQTVLTQAGLRVRELQAAAFCDGPGSVLGIRLSAASLRAWRVLCPTLACYSFHSLPLLAVAEPSATIVADARRDTWHAVRAGAAHQLLRLPSADLAGQKRLLTPASFRRWSAVPPGVTLQEHPWSVAQLLAAAPNEEFFENAPEPEAFMPDAPSYVAWTPKVHQAPAEK